MRKLLFPAAIILAALLLVSAAAAAGLTVETEPGLFRVSFTAPGESYAVVRFETEAERGWFTLFSADGVFAGEAALQCPCAPCRLTVRVERPDGRGIGRAEANYPGLPEPQGRELAFADRAGRVRDLELTPVDGGVAWAFTAQGHGSVILSWETSREAGSVRVYPEDNAYHYRGTLALPLSYRQCAVQITLKSGRGRGDAIGTGETTRGYTLSAAETEPAPGGRLSGVIVCIDPGHQNVSGKETEPLGPGLSGNGAGTGGMARGAVTRRKESIVMLECAYALRDELLRQGATVVMTRETEDIRVTNIERAETANAAGAHVMLRLHGDSNSRPSYRGFSVFYPMKSSYARAVADFATYRSYAQAVADCLTERATWGTGARQRVVGTNNYVGSNWARMPCFLIELGYMSNATDDVLLSIPEYQRLLAEALADGVYEVARMRRVPGNPGRN